MNIRAMYFVDVRKKVYLKNHKILIYGFARTTHCNMTRRTKLLILIQLFIDCSSVDMNHSKLSMKLSTSIAAATAVRCLMNCKIIVIEAFRTKDC